MSSGWRINLNGQKPPVRYSKPDRSELEMKIYSGDPDASAVILYDYGKTWFLFPDAKVVNEFGRQSTGFRIVFYRYFRIKILDNDALHLADVEIPMYHTALAREEVSKVHATTWNMEGGEIIKTRMEDEMVSTDQVDKNRDKIKFSMPDVRAGSVIEVEYTVTSEFLYNLPAWQFQHTVPVIRSEYEVVIPEYYHYDQMQQGYIPVRSESKRRMSKVMLTYQEEPVGLTHRVATHTRDVEYYEATYHYLAENVEAFPDEKYLTTADNYVSKIEFELASTKFPGKAEELNTNTWGTINRILLDDEDFGLQLSETGFLKSDAIILVSEYPGQVQRMNAAFDLIKHKLNWNGKYGKYTSAPLADIYHSGNGNAAEINLLLVSLLKEAGIYADPVILSTRDNGILDLTQPSLNRINYVVACATIAGRKYLMDATDPYSNINLLPPRCLNGRGMIVDEDSCAWIDLSSDHLSATRKNYELSLAQDGIFTGKTNSERTCYAAYNLRNELRACPDGSDDPGKMQENNPGLRITGYQPANLDSLNLPVLEEYNCTISGLCEKREGLILFTPLLHEALNENPFKLKERKYPVEFCYPFSEQYTMSITVPEGYLIESMPSSVQFGLPENAAGFVFNVSLDKDQIICVSTLDINRIFFLPGEYADLKLFFNKVIAKQAEKIVLKKILTD
jgi:hypothetical protein